MKVLITAGATREPIDAVRYLSNVSTGSTGAALAEALTARGHAVTLLHGEGAVVPGARVSEVETFFSTEDLCARLQQRLGTGEYDAVIMAAAVSDYRPETMNEGKISSDLATLTLRLVRNPKLLPQLKTFTSRPLLVVGFKLTVGADDDARRAAVTAQFAAGGVDVVVQNDLQEIHFAARSVHPFRLYRSAQLPPQSVLGVEALADALTALPRGT